MPVNDALGIRMKQYYEQVPKFKLYRRTPVAIRIDGKAFHTFTRGFAKPFDEVLGNAMVHTMEYLCKNIQGCVFGYTQSDEITLLLIDYQTFETDAWFDYEVQKMCSISASMATMAFNKFFAEEVHNFRNRMKYDDDGCLDNDEYDLWTVYNKAVDKGAIFDARCFNIPKEEATNLIYWRQVDAARNSVQMAARAQFSHAQCDNKNVAELQEMLFQEKGINWNDYPTRWKRGVACHKVASTLTLEEKKEELEWGEPRVYTIATQHYKWQSDYEMPILKGENRKYVDELIYIGD